jgi:hypothetical protein
LDRRNPYVFVVGCPRSGTTLLQRMLDNHPLLAVSNDTHFIPKALSGSPGDPSLTRELVERARSYHRFGRLGLSQQAVDEAARQAATYSEFVSGLYSAVARMNGKPLAGEKTPDYVRNIPLLHALFPRARFVHIVRDGRDVALSALNWAKPDKGPGRSELWKEQPVAVCALWWRRMVSAGSRDGVPLGSGVYAQLSYEDLVADAEVLLRSASAFLGLEYSPEMLSYYRGRTRREPGLSTKRAWLPPTSGLRDWRSQMPASDVELFEAIAGDLLAELGYERAFETISPSVAAVAERCEAWWEDEKERKRSKQANRARRLGLA